MDKSQDHGHIVYIGEDHWCIRHPFECFIEHRKMVGGMENCPFHKGMLAFDKPPYPPGDYRMGFGFVSLELEFTGSETSPRSSFDARQAGIDLLDDPSVIW